MIEWKLLLLFANIWINQLVSARTVYRSEYIAFIDSYEQSYTKYVTFMCGSRNFEDEVFNNNDTIPYGSSGHITKSEINVIRFHLTSVNTYDKCRFPKIRENFKFEQFKNVEEIDVSDVELETLEMTALRNAISVKKFIASNNRLTGISLTFFPRTEQIEELDLKKNTIQRIDPTALESAKSLKKLILSHNQISKIESHCFSVPTLEELDISQNLLAKVHENAFYGAINLKKLDLSYNVIGSLKAETFARLTNLEVLSLKHSEIISLEPGTLSHQQNLISLDLCENWLMDLDFNRVFPPILLQIKSINLTQNKLTDLNGCRDSIVPKLQVLDIRSNDFNCSYLLQLMYEVSWDAFNTTFDESLTNKHKPSIQDVNCKNEQKEANQTESPAVDNACTVQSSANDDLKSDIKFVKFSMITIFVCMMLLICVKSCLCRNGRLNFNKRRQEMDLPVNVTLPAQIISECKNDKE